MKTVQLTGSSRTTSGTRKKKKSKKGASVGVSEADLRKFGIVPVGGRRKKASSRNSTSATTGGKKRKKKKTAGASGRGLTKDVRKALSAAGIIPGGKTTGQPPIDLLRPGRRQASTGLIGQVGNAAWDLTSYGSGALTANAAGGLLNQLVERTGLFQKASSIPWRQLVISLAGAFIISMNWYRNWASDSGRKPNGFFEKNRKGMLGFFGFQAVYGLVRALTGPDYADMDLDAPDGLVQNTLSYFAGSNGMIGAGMMSAPGQMQQPNQAAQGAQGNTGYRRTTGGVLDLYQQSDYVARLASALSEVQAMRDDLTVALDGLYGQITDDQLSVYNSVADFISAADNRIALAQEETDLDRAADLVLEASSNVQTAQALLAGLTAGIGAPASQQAEAVQEAQQAQQMAQQHQAVAQQQQMQAQQMQAQAQQFAGQAQQQAALGQHAQAMQTQQQAMQYAGQAQQLQQAAAQSQAQAQQFSQQAMQATSEAQQFAGQAQQFAGQQVQQLPQAAPPTVPPNMGAPVQGWW